MSSSFKTKRKPKNQKAILIHQQTICTLPDLMACSNRKIQHHIKKNLAREVNLKSTGAATSRKYPRSNKNR